MAPATTQQVLRIVLLQSPRHLRISVGRQIEPDERTDWTRPSDSFKTSGSSRGIVEVMPTANSRVNATEPIPADPSDRPTDLTSLMNVGPAVAEYLARAGITRTEQLTGRDPVEIYELICARDGQRHDPCLLDTIMSAVDQANGNPPRPWWTYTPQRKAG